MNRVLIVVVAMASSVVLPAQGVIDLAPVKDNTLFESAAGDLSAGVQPNVFCGVTNLTLKRRAVLAFDAAGTLPAGTTVVSATLWLTVNLVSSGPLSLELHRVSADWGQGSSSTPGPGGQGAPAKAGDATWIHRFYPSVFWANQGGDFSALISAATSVDQPGVYSWSSAQLTADVQDWLDNPSGNFGWMLKAPEDDIGNAKRISSREAVSPSARPRLEVTYLAPPAASVLDFGTGCHGLHLGPVGHPMVGNPAFAVVVSGGVPGASAYVFPSDGVASPPLDLGGGCFFLLDLTSALSYVASGAFLGPASIDQTGHATLAAPIPPSAALHGSTIHVQAVSIGTMVTTSNALTLVLGS